MCRAASGASKLHLQTHKARTIFQHTVYIDYSDYRFGQASVRFGMCPGQHAPHQAARTASAEIIMMPITAKLGPCVVGSILGMLYTRKFLML